MLKALILFLTFTCIFQTLYAQKKYINRKIAQKNYEGYMLMQEQKYDSALHFFDAALKADPEAFFIYQNRAICRLYLKDTIGAISDYKTNINLEPNNAESLYSLGNILKHQKDSINSVKYFIKSIGAADINFNQKKLLYMNNFVGHFYRNTEKYDSALIYYNQVKKYTPQNSSVFINGALCYFKLDSIENFCSDLEQAYILGGAVNCYILKSYCKGCNHLLAEAGKTDTLSKALDTRLKGIISDTIFNYSKRSYARRTPDDISKKKKVFFNKYWQICLPENAEYYREAFWTPYSNFFGGNYTDYYINGNIYTKGRIEKTKQVGAYKSHYKNGNIKIKGQFILGEPNGKWTYFLENGEIDYEIIFLMDAFEFNFINESNSNFHLNSGTGKFEIVLDKWDDFKFIVSGEYFEKVRAGKWSYTQGKQTIYFEQYKKGKLKNAYVLTNIGKVKSISSNFNASTFIPPQINQIRNLFFDSVETPTFYPFIKLNHF